MDLWKALVISIFCGVTLVGVTLWVLLANGW